METNVREKYIYQVSKIVESFSEPYIGKQTDYWRQRLLQVAGIHADGDKKNNPYFNDLLPERFGCSREYDLAKLREKPI